MMGRLTDYEERENGNLAQGEYRFPSSEGRFTARNTNPTNTVSLHQNYNTSLPQIPSPNFDSRHLPFSRTDSALAAALTEGRAQTSLQERVNRSYHSSKGVRSCATSPTFKLPPLPSTKSTASQASVKMPPQSVNENLIPAFLDGSAAEVTNKDYPSMADMKLAYENMMIGYFMPEAAKNESNCLSECSQTEQLQSNLSQFSYDTNSKSIPSHPMNQNVTYSSEAMDLPYGNIPQELYQRLQAGNMLQSQMPNLNQEIAQNSNTTPLSNQQTVIPTNTSACEALRTSNLTRQELFPNSESLSNNLNTSTCAQLKQNYVSPSESISYQEASKSFQPTSDISIHNQSPTISTVLNELSMLITPQNATEIEAMYTPNSMNITPSSVVPSSTLSSVTPTSNTVPNVHYQTKMDPNWGRFSVLPPVNMSTPSFREAGNDSDTASLMSYRSASSNAQSAIQMGIYYNTVSPFSVNFSDNIPSAFTTSPRYSARSSYSSRSRNKRALSNSPLSAEGIDINTIIRMSPTSLNAYLNGSRSSSSCVSPGSYGEKTGCYGHLSARNSSSSPQSGSGSSGNRRSASYTPQIGTPSSSNPSNITSDNSNISLACSNSEKVKDDLFDLDDNLFIMQAMQDLESGAGLPMPPSFHTNEQVAPEFENLQVLPQDLAAFRTECYIPYVPTVLPPVHANIPSQYQQLPPQPIQTLVSHTKPPPTYDQHMARKATLQKNNSSDSSQPSNSNSSSFESSEGDKTAAGSSSTDNESCRMYACRWLDCTAVFQDQDEFVAHIEKVHIDQKKGDDFICFWKLCPRRLHPFNARYKLLVHMRIHSGDKPNKCTYAGCSKAFSRLENLKIHLRSHTGERPYSCTFAGCSKTFSNSSDRTKHQKTHHDTKPYVCQVVGCGKRYTDPSSLRKHVKKSHPDKKEPDRKKIRSAMEELDPKDLSECLVIQSIKPVTVYDASPPEPTDSGLGRSPRSSHPGSSSDHYPGIIYSGEGQGTSSQTSPSNQHSPSGQNDREKLPPNNNSLRVPILPPITPSPIQQQCFPSLKSPVCNTPNLSRVSSSALSGISKPSSNVMQTPRLSGESGMGSISQLYADCSSNLNSRNSNSYSMRHQSRHCS